MAFILLEITFADNLLYPQGECKYTPVLDFSYDTQLLQIKRFPSWSGAIQYAVETGFHSYEIYETSSLQKLKREG